MTPHISTAAAAAADDSMRMPRRGWHVSLPCAILWCHVTAAPPPVLSQLPVVSQLHRRCQRHCVQPALPPLRVNAGEAESEDPFAAVDTPQDVAAATGKLCMVCMDAPRNCRLRPCMHAALCTECAQVGVG